MDETQTQYWFVGAAWGNIDKTTEFKENEIWINGYSNRYLDLVNNINVGDKIAIKSSYTKLHDLPFENPKNNKVSVLKIKAIGTVTNNKRDGRNIDVKWDPSFIEKEWYFYTSRSTIWKPEINKEESKELIEFTFNGGKQDYDKFRNSPFRKDRYGDITIGEEKYKWTTFYQELASNLLQYKNNRYPLIEEIHKISKDLGGMIPLNDQYSDGTEGALKDICPFTVFALFNRQIKDDNKIKIAKSLATFLNVKTPVPTSFEAIPLVSNRKTWFFSYERQRNDNDIDILWEMFNQAILWADEDEKASEDKFINFFNKTNNIRGVGWNLTLALYWIRPWNFVSLDSNSREFIQKHLGIKFSSTKRYEGKEYLNICEQIDNYLLNNNKNINSFPDLSYTAVKEQNEDKSEIDNNQQFFITNNIQLSPKNILMYGPPGTGKTYNTINETLNIICNDSDIPQNRNEQKALFEKYVNNGQVIFTTFHQSLSYEDFIEGIKPVIKEGKITYDVVDGIFKEFALKAKNNWMKSQGKQDNSFETIWNKFTKPFEDDEKDSEIIINTVRSKFKIYEINENTIRFEKASGTKQHTLCINTVKKFYQDPESLNKSIGLSSYYKAIIEELDKIKNEIKPEINDIKEQLKQYVLIIDEINRGNVASIFGELITLLETDKRDGMPEKISTKLPYSRDNFTVPPNLNIIGTMNTADRSIEALDLALRRRFCFKEIMPNPDLFNQEDFIEANQICNLSKMLETINNRIIMLKDRDHVIGHSYFFSLLDCENINDELINIFQNKIIPLLEEYFYGDWQKIGMILGNSFVSIANNKTTFALGFDYEESETENIYTIKNPSEWNFKSIYE